MNHQQHDRPNHRARPAGFCVPAIGAGVRAVLTGVALLIFATGCGSMPRTEAAWQTMHAFDVAQTLNAASDPCYRETAWLTEKLIGGQPSDTQVLAWGVGTSVAHWWITGMLARHDAPQWLQRFWSLSTIGHTGYTIASNHNNGVRPWGDNLPVEGCNR